MTEKWADYLISAVRYNSVETHIDRVRCHVDYGESVGSAVDASRQGVVVALDVGTTFATVYRDPSDPTKWIRGAEVRAITVDGTKYIRTDADNSKRDNLGDLPRY